MDPVRVLSVAESQFVVRLLLAVALGSAIGVERQWRQRMAGLRTNALVSAGASLFCLLAQKLPSEGDYTKIPAYVVSGVGFLGAGVIMKDGATVRGLNTAATLWCSAAVGTLAGFGFCFDAAFAAMIVISTHLVLRPLAQRINRQPPEAVEEEHHYRVQITCRNEDENSLRLLMLQAVSSSHLILRSIHSEDIDDSRKVNVTAEMDASSKSDLLLEQIVNRLSLERGVSAATWLVIRKGNED